MAVDIKQLFNETLPKGLANNAEDAKGIGAKFQMNVTGEGEWFIDVTSTGPVCKAGTEAADCTITDRRGRLPEAHGEPAGQRHAALLRGQAEGRGQPDAGDEAPEALQLQVIP